MQWLLCTLLEADTLKRALEGGSKAFLVQALKPADENEGTRAPAGKEA